MGVRFKWTERTTLQQNSPEEVGFTTIGNRGQSMMIAANVPYAVQFALYRKAYTCATQLEWLVVVEINDVTKTRVEHW